MSLRIYNTLSGEKEPFIPVRAGHVGMYLCGPTVYKPPHIGHLVGPVIFDAIKRYLTHKGFAVNWVVNITDVDDKIINESAARGISMSALSLEQESLYVDVLTKLNVRQSIDHLPRASEHIPQIIAMTTKLIETKHAYAVGGDVWFDVASDADYGKLSNRRVDQQEAGRRELQGGGKKSPADFALWKAAKPGEPSWDSPWGPGRPGWHIECSAMSVEYLGDTLDIHGGGDDLKFPHHENELAQSECCTSKPFAKYWVHNGLTKIRTKSPSGAWRDEKMSKSTGNSVDAADLLARHGPSVLRYLLLSTHYRSPIEFSEDALAICRKSVEMFTRLIAAPEKKDAPASAEVEALRTAFFAAMDDDFNTGAAIGVLNKLAHAARQNASGAIAAIVELSGLLGLTFEPPPAVAEDHTALLVPLQTFAAKVLHDGVADTVPAIIEQLIARRAEAKMNKDFKTADAIRNGLTALKVALEDSAGGTIWRTI